MLYTSEYSAGPVNNRNNDLTVILHLVSILVIFSRLLARDKILLKLVPRYIIRYVS
jgi:hypothetical protein